MSTMFYEVDQTPAHWHDNINNVHVETLPWDEYEDVVFPTMLAIEVDGLVSSRLTGSMCHNFIISYREDSRFCEPDDDGYCDCSPSEYICTEDSLETMNNWLFDYNKSQYIEWEPRAYL